MYIYIHFILATFFCFYGGKFKQYIRGKCIQF